MEVEDALKQETDKWLERMKNEMENIELLDDSREYMVQNIRAYISDSEIFLKQGELVMAFEAVLWAWAIFETLRDLKIITTKSF